MWKLFAEVSVFFLIMLKFSSGFAANGEVFWKDETYDFSKICNVLVSDVDTLADVRHNTEIQEKYKLLSMKKSKYQIISIEKLNITSTPETAKEIELFLENISDVADIWIRAKVDSIATETQHFPARTYTRERKVEDGREKPNFKKYGDGPPPKRYKTIKETVKSPAYDRHLIYLTVKFEVYDTKTKKVVMNMTGQRTGYGTSTNIKMYDQIFKSFFKYLRKSCK